MGHVVVISADDPRPPYVQIAADIRRAIEVGDLQPGQRLDSGRALADRYGVAAMTVQRAIQQLKAQGLLVTSQGRGVFVSDTASAGEHAPDDSLARLDRLELAVQRLTERVADLAAKNNDPGHQ